MLCSQLLSVAPKWQQNELLKVWIITAFFWTSTLLVLNLVMNTSCCTEILNSVQLSVFTRRYNVQVGKKYRVQKNMCKLLQTFQQILGGQLPIDKLYHYFTCLLVCFTCVCLLLATCKTYVYTCIWEKCSIKKETKLKQCLVMWIQWYTCYLICMEEWKLYFF